MPNLEVQTGGLNITRIVTRREFDAPPPQRQKFHSNNAPIFFHATLFVCLAQIREDTSVERARAAFSDMVGIPGVVEAVDACVGMAAMAVAEGRDPSEVPWSSHNHHEP